MPQPADTEADAERAEPVEAGGRNAPFDLSQSPSHLLHRALQFAGSLFDPDDDARGLTRRQFVVLAAIAAREGRTQTELVRATGVDRSTLAELIGRLVKRGLVMRERDTLDGRANLVRLTPAGRSALDAGTPVVAAVDAAILNVVPKDLRADFLQTLARLADAGGESGDTQTDRGAARPKKRSLVEPRKTAVKADKAGKRGKKKKAKAEAVDGKTKKTKKQKSK